MKTSGSYVGGTALTVPEISKGNLENTGRNQGCGVGFFYPTPEAQLNHFLHRTPKLEDLTRAC